MRQGEDDSAPLTEAESDAAYAPAGAVDAGIAAHEAAADPHPQYAVAAELAAAIAAHEAAGDPHTQYMTAAEVATALAGTSGAFTPTVLGATTAGVGTYTTQTGAYNRRPGLVFFKGLLVWTAHTGTGAMRLGGLPFTAASDLNVPISVHNLNNIALTASNVLTAAVLGGTQQIQLGQSPAGGGAFASVPIDTAGSIAFAGFYFE